tara:strand:+ start:163 stop:549 length:387 start_codon:yes stop_codon:yes gene_type:complete
MADHDDHDHHHHGHVHGPDCGHDHGHDHGDDDHTLSVQIANQIINVANTRLESGLQPEVIAEGLRHAAANFSAFVAQHTDPDAIAEGHITEEFHHMLEYYAQVHGGQHEQPKPAAGLHQLINQVKDEF